MGLVKGWLGAGGTLWEKNRARRARLGQTDVYLQPPEGYKTNSGHIWLTKDDLTNAPLMILLGYIIIGHPDWKDAEISVFACFPGNRLEQELENLNDMIVKGRLPISSKKVTPVFYGDESSFELAAVDRSSNG